jgi:hypothetical protein
MKYTHVVVNWSPYATNILDASRYHLCLPNGEKVDFRQDGMDFVLTVAGKEMRTSNNLTMSYWMNTLNIGGIKKAGAQ